MVTTYLNRPMSDSIEANFQHSLVGDETYLNLPNIYRVVTLPDGTETTEIDPQATLEAAQEIIRKHIAPPDGDTLRLVFDE